MLELSQRTDGAGEILHKMKVSPEDVLLFARADLNAHYDEREIVLAATKDTLLISDGDRVQTYALKDLQNPAIEEKIGNCVFIGEYQGKRKLLATLTNSRKQECRLFAKYLKMQMDTGEITVDEQDFLQEQFCPKCHRRYPDPNRKVCPDCMDKASIVGRFLTLAKKFKGQILLALLAMAITSILGIVSPYLSTSFFYDQVLDIRGKFYGDLLFVVTLMLATQIATILITMVSDIVTAKVSARIIYDLKRTIFDSIRRLSMRFFTGRQTGGLMTQINRDSNAIYWFFVNGFPVFFSSLIQVVTVFILMLTIDVPLAIASLIPLPFYLYAVTRVLKQQRWMNARSYARNRSMNSVLSDSLNGVRVVKAFAREKEETGRFNYYSTQAAEMTRKLTYFHNTRHPSLNLLIYFSTLLVWGVGGWMAMKGQITYGTLMVFISYVGILNGPMFSFVNMSDNFTRCVNGMQRLFEIADASPDVVEAEHPVSMPEIRGDVEFRDVEFSYEKGRKTLEGISFKISAGHRLGIVGHSGAGKSTLANLLIRLYDVDSGGVYIDGVNVKDMAFEDLRRSVSIVSQETYLFAGTVLENIAYANPDASKEEILHAARIAGAHDFIMRLPNGYHTKIGFGHQDLSGGERQRISIARAILKDPKILILDEATAAMDTATERTIQEALERLSENRTTIMIAHRLSTLRNADSLIVIEKGKMPETGTHVELLKQKGIYYRLYQLQLSALKNIGVEE